MSSVLRSKKPGRLTRPYVIKLGGELLEEPRRLRQLARALSRLASQHPLIVVHGGGRAVDTEMTKLGLQKRSIDGLRVTDGPTLDVVLGVLAGRVNTRLVAAIGATGGRAVGVTGADAGIAMVRAARKYRTTNGTFKDLGFVGVPKSKTGSPRLLLDLVKDGYVPVIASIGTDEKGQLYNVNADTLSADIAVRLKADQLTIAGTTRGVLDDEGNTIPVIDDCRMTALIRHRHATAGMVAKLIACQAAGGGGVGRVSIVDGRRRGALNQNAKREMTLVTATGKNQRTSLR